MNQASSFILAGVLVEDRLRNVLVLGGEVAGFPEQVEDGLPVWDARGGRLIPGLADHHLHLFSAAASLESVDLASCGPGDTDRCMELIRSAAERGRVRATGYDEECAGPLDRWRLDALCGPVPVRVQYRTGSLWVLNGAALDLVLPGDDPAPPAFERDSAGRLNGRVWRGDAFLRKRWMGEPPSLAPLGAMLARWGVTAVTDASATTDQRQGDVIAKAAERLPQRLMLMGGSGLRPPANRRFAVGPVKILLDEFDLPPIESVIGTIVAARAEGRCVAAHCVTPAELALMVSAFAEAGAVPGDRIEHGSIIPEGMLPVLADLELTVVTQPGFIASRGDRYLRQVEPTDQGDLYRLASLIRAGIKVAGSSDAPYGPPNPWIGIRAAVDRRTLGGAVIGAGEGLGQEQALALFWGSLDDPAGPPRSIKPGAAADLCLLRPGALEREEEDPVALTVIGGRIAYAQSGFH